MRRRDAGGGVAPLSPRSSAPAAPWTSSSPGERCLAQSRGHARLERRPDRAVDEWLQVATNPHQTRVVEGPTWRRCGGGGRNAAA